MQVPGNPRHSAMGMMKIPNTNNEALLLSISPKHGRLQFIEHLTYKCWKAHLCRHGWRNGHRRQLWRRHCALIMSSTTRSFRESKLDERFCRANKWFGMVINAPVLPFGQWHFECMRGFTWQWHSEKTIAIRFPIVKRHGGWSRPSKNINAHATPARYGCA